MQSKVMWLAGVAVFALWVPAARADEKSELIKSAEAAGPAAVASKATIYAMGADGKMQTLREGTNGWWCMPDQPTTPTKDPMCGDANAMEWANAWMNKTDPPKDKVGLIYMLAGGSDASNTDPYATGKTNDNQWITTGPHVMILNAMHLMSDYPAEAQPDTAKPYVMWANTPYAHLMVPVQ